MCLHHVGITPVWVFLWFRRQNSPSCETKSTYINSVKDPVAQMYTDVWVFGGLENIHFLLFFSFPLHICGARGQFSGLPLLVCDHEDDPINVFIVWNRELHVCLLKQYHPPKHHTYNRSHAVCHLHFMYLWSCSPSKNRSHLGLPFDSLK